MSRIIATWFYAGYLRPAPGTWGSLAALPFAWALHVLGGPWLLFAATLVVFAVGWWATIQETRGQADHDPSEIVVDEVAGQWLALLPVSYGATFMDANVLRLWPGIVAGFVLFRLFDILKPGPIGTADRRGDALGVMLDDVLAGIAAALVTIVLAVIAHGFLV